MDILRKNLVKSHKQQVSLEYLAVFTGALIIVALVILALYFLSQNRLSSTVPSQCYLTSNFYCVQAAISPNGTSGSQIVVVLSNRLGREITLPASNAIAMRIGASSDLSYGTCLPTNSPSGGKITCVTQDNGYSTSLGNQTNLDFAISYSLCVPSCTSNSGQVKTAGTAIVYGSPYVGFYEVNIGSTKSTQVTLDGVPYPTNTLMFLDSVGGDTAAAGQASLCQFGSWSGTGGVSVSASQQTTPVSADGAGILTENCLGNQGLPNGYLTLAPPTPATQVAQILGQQQSIYDAGASGGITPYVYQWLEKAPGAASYTDAVDCAAPTTTTCTFTPSGTQSVGTYQFELQVTDSETPKNTIVSSPANVIIPTFLFVVDTGTNAVSVINTATNTVELNLPVGFVYDDAIAMSPNGQYVAVGDEYGHELTKISTTNYAITNLFFGSDVQPVNLAFNPSGSDIFVADDSNGMSEVDTTTWTVVNTITDQAIKAVLGFDPIVTGVSVSPDGKYVYLSSQTNTGAMCTYSTATNTVIGCVIAGEQPVSLAVSPDGKYVYMPPRYIFGGGTTGAVEANVIEAPTGPVVKNIPIGSNPISAQPNPSGTQMWISNFNGGGCPTYGPSTISVIDLSSQSVVQTIQMNNSHNTGTVAVAFSPDGQYAYTVNICSGDVSVIDTSNYNILGKITIGSQTYPLQIVASNH